MKLLLLVSTVSLLVGVGSAIKCFECSGPEHECSLATTVTKDCPLNVNYCQLVYKDDKMYKACGETENYNIGGTGMKCTDFQGGRDGQICICATNLCNTKQDNSPASTSRLATLALVLGAAFQLIV